MSIPVHEDEAVVLDQLSNIEHFLEDPVTVLHVSADFDVDPSVFTTSERVLVNPERLRTGWGNGIIAWAHVSNILHALRTVDFDYAVMAASNELYVRSGVESYLARYDAGVTPIDFSSWPFRVGCMGDVPLLRLLRRHGRFPTIGHIEGIFFGRTVIEEMLALLEPVLEATPWDDVDFGRSLHDGPEPGRLPLVSSYPREEVYLPTAIDICGPERLGRGVTYLNWGRLLELSEEEIEAVRAGELGEELYSVKRVPREFDSPLRDYIRTLG